MLAPVLYFGPSIIGDRQAEPEQLGPQVLAVGHHAGADPEVLVTAEILQVDNRGSGSPYISAPTGPRFPGCSFLGNRLVFIALQIHAIF